MSPKINCGRLSFFLLSSLIVLSLIGIPAVSGNAGKWFARSASHSSTVTVLATSEASLSAEARNDRIEAELITITPDGFEPHEITRPKGRVLLVVTNRSGLPELSLRLDFNGNRIRQFSVSNEILDWSEIVDLPAGDYVLTEANHADWVCHITITDE